MKPRSAQFEYEGNDMMYDVIWNVAEDSTIDAVVYADGHNVTNLLFDDVLANIIDLAWDEYYGG